MNKKTIVELNGVVCAVGDRAILEIDGLTIVEGERIAVLGANGAGKSTLLRLLGGIICPQHGEVRVLDRALNAPLESKKQRALRRDVGQIMQGLHLVPRLTAIENVLIGCLARVNSWRSIVRWYPPNEIEAAKTALNAVGMMSRAHTRADRLSGGERQKVAIARLLMQRPRLILADEPTAALDPAAAADVCQLLVRAASGATLITVVHNPSLLPVLANRAIGIKHGAIAFDCPVADVTDERLVGLYRPGERDQARFIATTAGGQLVSHMEENR
ncbi:MAG: phosphonate ABC transporter ATP-binding protein [Burkholderiaceae bacterium]